MNNQEENIFQSSLPPLTPLIKKEKRDKKEESFDDTFSIRHFGKPMQVWNAKVRLEHSTKTVHFERTYPSPGQPFTLKARDYEELYHEFCQAKSISKKKLNSLPGPCVHSCKVKLPHSGNKLDIRIIILRTTVGFEAHLRVYPLCKEGFIKTEANYKARQRGEPTTGPQFIDFGFALLRSDELLPIPATWYPSPSATVLASLKDP